VLPDKLHTGQLNLEQRRLEVVGSPPGWPGAEIRHAQSGEHGQFLRLPDASHAASVSDCVLGRELGVRLGVLANGETLSIGPVAQATRPWHSSISYSPSELSAPRRASCSYSRMRGSRGGNGSYTDLQSEPDEIPEGSARAKPPQVARKYLRPKAHVRILIS